MKNEFKDLTLDEERALYHLEDAHVSHCLFAGERDGESPLKECRRTHVSDCEFRLRYALWHDVDLTVENSVLGAECRAPLWYCRGISMKNTVGEGVKAFRECDGVALDGCRFRSDEIFWRCRTVAAKNSSFTGFYPFFESRDITLDGVCLTGKYSFQYVENLNIRNSDLQTKDAFWHSKNVTVEDSTVSGEYLGWYSENLRLVRCHIVGTQPLCYCKNLVLEDCTMEGCDFSFEFSDVTATVKGHILSVKNPKSGVIRADSVGEVILENDTPYPVLGKVEITK